jgi:hypothetical protein
VSMFESRHDLSDPKTGATELRTIADDAMLRAIGVLVLLGIGAMHFLQIVATFKGTPLLGGAYLVLIAACVAVAAGLVTRGDSRAWTAAAIVGAGAIGCYIFTRAMSTPLDNQDVGNWSCMLGLAALFVETSLLVLSGYTLMAKRSRTQEFASATTDIKDRLASGRTAA